MESAYLNFQVNPSPDFVSMSPYIYQPQNVYYLPDQESTSPNFYPVIQNQLQSNPVIINDQQPIIYSTSPTSNIASTINSQQQKPLSTENDPFFIPIQGIVPPSKNADGRYECNICNRTYTHAKHLKRHTMRHTGQKPYECAYCSAKFTRPDIRTRHALKCRITKLKESNGGVLPDNMVHNSALGAQKSSAKDGSVKKNSHPATCAATKAIFKCAPQVPSAITAMNRAKNVAAAAAAAASLASNILSPIVQTRPTPASSSITSAHHAASSNLSSAANSPSSNSLVLSPINNNMMNYASQQHSNSSSFLIPTPDLQPTMDYPTPVSMGASPSSDDDKYYHQSNESLSGYITPVEPQLSIFSQTASQTALVDPELCRVDPMSMNQFYTNINSMNPVVPMPASEDLNNTYCIYNANQNMVMNNMGAMSVNMAPVPMNGMVSESQPMLFPVNVPSSTMKW